jgi:membrane-bound serine protease (ClpP class)
MLIDGPIPALRLPLGLVLPVSLTVAALCAWAVRLAARAQRLRVATGIEGLAAEIGTVSQPLAPQGKVFIHGELWDAVTAGAPLAAGSRVRVVSVDSMRLVVAPAEGPEPPGGERR